MEKIKVKLDCDVEFLDAEFNFWLSWCVNDFCDSPSLLFAEYNHVEKPWTMTFSKVDEND